MQDSVNWAVRVVDIFLYPHIAGVLHDYMILKTIDRPHPIFVTGTGKAGLFSCKERHHVRYQLSLL